MYTKICEIHACCLNVTVYMYMYMYMCMYMVIYIHVLPGLLMYGPMCSWYVCVQICRVKMEIQRRSPVL